MDDIKRRQAIAVPVGSQWLGGNHPIVVQSMTNTDTTDIALTTQQIIELAEAGSEIVRVTVNNEDAAKAVVDIKNLLVKKNCSVPLVGDFHYNGHRLLALYPDCAQALDKYRINPGNVGFKEKRDRQFAEMVEIALRYDKPIRIGVNWGSLDRQILTQLMDENAQKNSPLPSNNIMSEAIIQSCLLSAKFAESLGMEPNRIVLSAKVSETLALIRIYRALAKRCNYALHLGLTEAGMGMKGIIASAVALSPLLLDGIGDTIRISLTPAPGEPRIHEVKACKQLLQSLGIRQFTPQVTACPGCGRTTSTYFQELTQQITEYLEENMKIWRLERPDVSTLRVAVMGCIVNGPGESQHAHIGISLPGTNENPKAPVFVDGLKVTTLEGDEILPQFKKIIRQYIEEKYPIKSS